MYRHSPVRNPRSKGIKIKHVLQGCLLVAVCFWLIFQVKRSHDKKKEFDAHDNKISLSTSTRGSDEIVKLGRKDIQPKLEGTTKEIEIHEETQEHEQEDEDEHEEHEDNKHEEEDQDEDKIEEEKDDGGGGGDDEIDENEQEKSDVEIDREEGDIIDEDKETEESDESDEKETEEKDGQSQSQTENEGSTVDHDEDGSTVHTNKAHEEHYKADDASSAVTHNGRNLGTENEIKNGTSDNSSGDVGLVDNGQTAENTTSSNVTMTQEKDYQSIVTSLNATSSINSHDNGPPSSTTVMTSDSTEAQNVTVSVEQDGNSSVASSVGDQLVSNPSLAEITEGSSNSTNISKETSSDPSKTEVETNKGEGEGEGEGENLDTTNVTEGIEESLDPDEVEHDAIDSTDPSHLEEKEVRTDLDTLPEIETEGSNSENTAAE